MEQRGVHCSILNPISQLRQERGLTSHWLVIQPVFNERTRNVDRRSIQYLVKFLQGGKHDVTELELESLILSSQESSSSGFWGFLRSTPPCCTNASSLEILHDFLANDSTLTTLHLSRCNFGDAHDVSRLLAAFYTNQSLTDLHISEIQNLKSLTLANFLAGLFHTNTQLLRFSCRNCSLSHSPAVRIFQPGLATNTSLKELCLSNCQIQDDGLASIADALVGNTTMDVLDISYNCITSNGLVDITRILEFTQLRKVDIGHNHGDLLNNQGGSVPRFAHALSRNKFMRTLDMSTDIVSSLAAAMIFQALESNTTLEKLSLGRPTGHATNDDTDTHLQQCVVDQFIKSLPKMKGIRVLRLGADGWQQLLVHHAVLLASSLHQNTSLEQLPGLEVHYRHDPELHKNVVLATLHILERNRCLHCANSLLQPQPQPQTLTDTTGSTALICSRNGIWYMAMAQMGRNRSGASAIFQLFQNRPDLVEQCLHQ